MEPIVSPWLVYIVDKADVLYSIFALLAVFSICGFIFALIPIVTEDYIDDATERTLKKIKRISIVVFIVSILALVFVPNSYTAYKMLGASYLTPDNVNQVVDTIKGYGK
jgi:uncharacterized membrane protein